MPTAISYAYSVPELFNQVFIRLYRYPPDYSRQREWVERIKARLIEKTEAVLISKKPFPLSDFITNGEIDRALLVLALIFFLLGLASSKRRDKKDDSIPQD